MRPFHALGKASSQFKPRIAPVRKLSHDGVRPCRTPARISLHNVTILCSNAAPSVSLSPSLHLSRRRLCTEKPHDTHMEAASGNSVSFSDVPGVRSEGDKYAMMYTCTVCDTRAAKMISKQAYHHGTVLIRCPQCQNLHLIADHLGQFEEKGWTVEQFLETQGERVQHVASDNVLELTMADIAGAGGTSSEQK